MSSRDPDHGSNSEERCQDRVEINKHLSVKGEAQDKYIVELCDDIYVDMDKNEVDRFRASKLYLSLGKDHANSFDRHGGIQNIQKK